MSATRSLLPVIFKHKNLKQDVRLKVFFTDFHVHSSILKSNSRNFSAYFDWVDKKGTGGAASGQSVAGFKYEMVTDMFPQFDDRIRWGGKIEIHPNDWHLIDKGANARYHDLSMFERNPEIPTRTQAFKNLLCAMYNQKYELDADACRYADDLLEMAVLGRLNGALPAVSRSLSTVLHLDSTAKPRIEFRGCPRLLLVAATDLRLPKLFKDALIFTLGPWEEPEFVLLRKKSEEFPEMYPQLLDGKIIKITEDAYSKLCAKILSVNKALLADLASMDQEIKVQFKDSRTECRVSDICKAIDGDDKLCPPSFYRRLYHAKSKGNVEKALRKHIEPLMENNLTLTPTTGVGEASEKYFLCVTIADEELPWDIKKTESWIANHTGS